MAITRIRGPNIRPSATGRRPHPLQTNPQCFNADLGRVYAQQLDDNSVILLPHEYVMGPYLDDDVDSPDANWRNSQDETYRCWKTTVLYEQIDQNHPNLVPYLGQDPYTALPILARSSTAGPPLQDFMRERETTMYTAPLDELTTRVLPLHRPLMYKWAQQLISALAFIHSHDIVFGDVKQTYCWLSDTDPAPDVSLVGFLDAGFGSFIDEARLENSEYFDWRLKTKPTKQTDLFLYGCLVAELMIGSVAFNAKIKEKDWPVLETEYMGDIVRKCWKGEFADAEEAKAAVEAFLATVAAVETGRSGEQ